MSGDEFDLDAIEARVGAAPTGSRCVCSWQMAQARYIAQATEDVPTLVAEVRRLRAREDETARQVQAWVRHGRAVPADVTTYDREIVNTELLAIVERS